MRKAFIYEWTDNKTGLKYVGRHIGTIDDGYIGSGTIFKKEYNKRPLDFTRAILWIEDYINDESIKAEEEKILSFIPDDELFYGKNPKYYNQVKNSHGFTCIDNPMLNRDIVLRMMQTRQEKCIKNPWENTISKYGEAKWKEINSSAKIGNNFGTGNKNKNKTKEHKEKISESIKKLYEVRRSVNKEKSNNTGRPRAVDYDIIINSVKDLGFEESAKKFNLSVAALKSRYYNALKTLR